MGGKERWFGRKKQRDGMEATDKKESHTKNDDEKEENG